MGSLHTASRATSPASGEVEVELPRWDLYRLLADPIRLRLLALTAVEELAVSELAELLGERQPKVSRQTGALRDAGVLHARRRGSWLLLRLRPDADRDPVLGDALRTGRQLCEADGSLARVASILQRRDEATRAFFERSDAKGVGGPPSELGNYLRLLAPMLPHRSLAVDAGTGDGSLLEVLCPLFGRVIAVDRAEAQLEQARRRAEDRGFGNVHFFHGELAGEALTQLVAELNPDRWGADAVVAARVLHHAPVPAQAVKSLAALAAPREANYPGGAVLVLDYEPHDDAPLRERQADLWPGFEREELEQWAAQAGLTDIEAGSLPMRGNGTRTDRSLQWQWLSARRGKQRE